MISSWSGRYGIIRLYANNLAEASWGTSYCVDVVHPEPSGPHEGTGEWKTETSIVDVYLTTFMEDTKRA